VIFIMGGIFVTYLHSESAKLEAFLSHSAALFSNVFYHTNTMHCCVLVCCCRDIFSLTKNPQLLSDCVTLLVNHIKKCCSDVDVIVGLDARGFIFGSLVAQQMSLPFVPVRKEGKLPGETVKVAYTVEYSKVSDSCIDMLRYAVQLELFK